MRSLLAVLVVLLGFGADASAQGPACTTNLCMQQVACPTGTTTSVSGVVYAPNGTDPLPNVTVYIPNTPVAAFTPGVSCPVVGTPPSGTPIAGATTAVDGSFTIDNMPVGTNIPLVIVSGRWRRQLVIPSTTACVNTVLPSTAYSTANPVMPFASFPQNSTQGDIPKFAIATGGVDSVECVLRKVGIQDSEFTDANAATPGRINLFKGDYGPGAEVDPATPSENTLMGNYTGSLSQYDVLMLPCEGGAYVRPSAELAALITFANSGGRVYSSHYAYSWMYKNPPFDTVVNWLGSSGTTYADGTVATVNSAFSGGATLSQWLIDVGAASNSTPPAQIPLKQIKHDFNGVNAPTESWLTLDVTGNPVMQFVFDTPVGATAGQCGRVLYNEYHVETPVENNGSSANAIFPAECSSASTAMTPQEKLLEYSLFELTNDGGAATLAPTTQSFGNEALGFTSAVQTITWTNNSSFPASVNLLTGSTDFNVTGNNCTNVAAYGSCSITMTFTPSMLGAETGTLTVGSSGTTLTAALTGTGVVGASLSPLTLNFGNQPVGFNSAAQSFTWTNLANATTSVTSITGSTDFNVTGNNCTNVAPSGTCTINVVFKPSILGAETGTLTVVSLGSTLTAALSGTGVPDLTLATAGINFGNEDVGFKLNQMVNVTNSASGAVQFSVATTGSYMAASQCGGTLGAGATCSILVTFAPTTSGPAPGTLTLLATVPGTSVVLPGVPATLTGNGVDFTFTATPTSSNIIAGNNTTFVTTTTPLAGFATLLSLTCTTNAPASTCKLSSSSFTPSAAVNTTATITTTSQYAVVGYGIAGTPLLALLGFVSAMLLWMKRRSLGPLARSGLTVGLLAVLLGAASLGLTGCSGKLPAQNAVYTTPGTYTFTVSATDGQLVHAATYSMTVTEK